MKKIYFNTMLLCLMASATTIGQNFTKVTGNLVTNNSLTSWGNSWVDYNNDGRLDLFVNDKDQHRLFRNDGAGVFTNITPSNLASPTPLGFYYTTAWADYNNDGYLDLIMGNDGDKRAFYTGSAGGTFNQVNSGPEVTDMFHSFNLSWCDYNRDGFVDLFCSNIGNTSMEKNNLYKNNGGSSFTKITTGNIVNDINESWGHSWADYDNDGCPDLFVANLNNDFLYKNNCDGTFTKITSGTIVNDGKNSQGCSWGDYNNDGYLDLFVAVWGDHCFLYKNNGDGTFTKILGSALDNNTDQCTGSGWADYDNDGYLDLFVCCWITNGQTHNRLYHNNGNGTFTEITTSPLTATQHASNGCNWTDYNNDGFVDLYVTNKSTSNELFHNDGNSNSWVSIQCIGIASNRAAIGTKVRVKAIVNGTPMWQMREIGSMAGQFAQGNMRAAFGFGNATMLDSVRIEWPSGTVCTFTNVLVNQFLTIQESCNFLTTGIQSQRADQVSVNSFPNPFTDLVTVSYELTDKSDVTLTVTDELGRNIINLAHPAEQPGKYEAIITSEQFRNAGIYFYTLSVGGKTHTGKIIYNPN